MNIRVNGRCRDRHVISLGVAEPRPIARKQPHKLFPTIRSGRSRGSRLVAPRHPPSAILGRCEGSRCMTHKAPKSDRRRERTFPITYYTQRTIHLPVVGVYRSLPSSLGPAAARFFLTILNAPHATATVRVERRRPDQCQCRYQ